jgi:hypothetical protein
MTSLLPYANQGETISVGIDFLETEKQTIGTNSFLVDRTNLDGPFAVRIEAQLPSKIDQAVPPNERDDPPIAVVATLKSIDGLVRSQTALKPIKKNLYRGEIILDPSVISEAASICVLAVRKADGGKSGYAKQKGARLAWSETYEVRLTERPLPKGKFLRVVWEDFETSVIVPIGFRDSFFYVHIAGTEPVLYLNKNAKTPLVKLMETKGHGHPKAPSRDLLFSSIAVPVWLALCHSALEALRKEGGDGQWPVDFEDAFRGNWRGEVLKHVSEIVFPDLPAEEALFEFCSKMGESDYYANVLARAQVAIQSEHKVLDRYAKFAEEVYANE